MHIVITDVGSLVDEVPTMYIALKTIIIVVVAIFAFFLKGVRPNVIGKVWMGNINTCVENSNDRALAVDDRFVPKFLHTIVIKIPLVGVQRITRIVRTDGFVSQSINAIVWLGELNLV